MPKFIPKLARVKRPPGHTEIANSEWGKREAGYYFVQMNVVGRPWEIAYFSRPEEHGDDPGEPFWMLFGEERSIERGDEGDTFFEIGRRIDTVKELLPPVGAAPAMSLGWIERIEKAENAIKKDRAALALSGAVVNDRKLYNTLLQVLAILKGGFDAER